MSITPIDYFKEVKNNDDIEVAVKSSQIINKIVNENLQFYSIINVSQAMTDLANVGDLLKVANAASRGYPSSVAIIEVLSDYQSLVNNCEVTIDAILQNCFTCLNFYKFSIQLCESKKYDKSLLIVSKAADIAKKLADRANEIAEQANKLLTLSLTALEKSTTDSTNEIKKFHENELKKEKLEADCESLRSEVNSLNDQIKELKQLEEDAAQEEREENILDNIIDAIEVFFNPFSSLKGGTSSKSNSDETTGQSIDNMIKKENGEEDLTDDPKDSASVKVIKKQKRLKKQKDEKQSELEKKEATKKELDEKEKNGSITPNEKSNKEELEKEITQLKEDISKLDTQISNVSSEVATQIKENIEKSKDKEAEYRKLKNQYQDLKREKNGQLAADLQSIKNLVETNYNIDVGIKSLQIVITSMGKVKTCFDNTRVFWLAVEAHCKRLSNLSHLKILFKLIKPERPNNVIKFENEIKKSGINWLSLAYINLQAYNSITSVKKGVDDIMTNLPNKSEAKEIVKKTTEEIQKKLEKENNEIEEIKKNL